MDLMNEIEQLLSKTDVHILHNLHKLINDDKNKQFLYGKASEILTLMVTKFNCIFKFAGLFPKVFAEVLELLAEHGNPKDVLEVLLMGLTSLENEGHHETDILFLFMPISKALQKIPGKRGKSLEDVLGMLYSRVSLHIRNYFTQDGHFRMSSLECYLLFFEPFVEEVSLNAQFKKRILYSNRFYQQREMLQRYLVMLCYHPLIRYDGDVSILLCLLAKMFSNIFDVFNCSFDFDNPDETQANFCDNWQDLAMGNLAYLMLKENSVDSYRPYVYQHRFLFKKFVPLALLLMDNGENYVKEKGCWLFYALLQPLSDQELTTDYFSMEQFEEFCQLFPTLTSFFDKFGAEYFQLITQLLTALDRKRCYDFLLSMLKILMESKRHALIICHYRNFLENIWGKPGFLLFVGDNLLEFLQNCILRKDRTKVDVLYEFHSIYYVCRLIRLVAEKDSKQKNVSGLWNFYPLLNSKLLRPFLKSIEYTRMFCKKYKKSPKGIKLQKMKRTKSRLHVDAEFKAAVEEKKFTPMHLEILEDMLTENINLTRIV